MRTRALVLAVVALSASQRVFAQGEGPDHAKKRWEWFYQQRAYPFGTIPSGALSNARAQLSSMRASSMLRASGSSAPAPIAGTHWDPLGPTLIGVRDIGRTSVIAIHPTNGNIMYVGGAQGGVWKTTDGGVSWTPLTDKQCSLAMGSIAIDPVNPQIVYAATGEQHFSGDSYYGCGVLRSADGGATWTQLGASSFMGTGHASRIARIVVVPSTAGTIATTTLYAAADNGLWKSTNGGATWGIARTGYYTDVVLADATGTVLYAANYGVGVFRSDNAAGFWNALGTGFPTDSLGRINIALAKSAPGTIYASIGNGTVSSNFRGMYKSVDGANSWVKLAATNASCAPQCWYDQLLAVHPTDANVVYFGGVSMFKSTDGGVNFNFSGTGLHSDQHFLTFDPSDATKIYLTSDGGVFRSTDAGVSWQSISAGLGITQFYPGIALHPTDPNTILAGTQDNGTLLTTGSLNWTAAFGGDGGWSVIDYENPLIRYVETQSPGGPRRTDNGVNYTGKSFGITLSDPALFIPPLVMDPTDPKVLYYGTNKVYRTADRAETWGAISPSFTGAVTTIVPAPSNPLTVYAGNTFGQVQVTKDLASWTSNSTGLPQRTLTDIAVDRTDANTVYSTFSGFGTGHVFRSVNSGTSWTNVSGNLPDMPVNAVALDPASRAFVMVGTDLGVFVSTDSGTTWTVVDDGMPNVAVFDIAYNANTGALIAATHGRGMFKLQLNRPLTLVATPVQRRTDVLEGSTTAIADSASVILSGVNAGTSSWTATHTAAATWLSFSTAAGTGSGRVRWSRNPTGLAPGVRVDTITLTSAGAADSPLRIIDTLNVISLTPAISVDVPRRGGTLASGTNSPFQDSALVTITGGTPNAPWTAAVTKANSYITFITASGAGTGRVRWGRRADTLKAGVYYDTIVVTSSGATGSPATIADSVIVKVNAQLGTFSRNDTLISGNPTARNATTTLTIIGDPGSTAWTVTHNASATWNTVTTTSGAGNTTLQWTKNSSNLANGTYFDTITVTVAGLLPIKLPDITVVVAPVVPRACAIDHFFGTSCLDATQLKWMDLTGNNDGTFNLGDFLSFLARTPLGPEPPPSPSIRRPKP